MKNTKCWSDYTSYKQFEDLVRQDKKKAIKQRILDMIAGIGLAIMVYAFTVIFLSL
jgi:hypothetical protein